MFNTSASSEIVAKNARHFKMLSVLLFLTYFIGIFITRGHALLAGLTFVSLLSFTPYPRKFPKLSAITLGIFALFSGLALFTSATFSPDNLYALGSAAATIGFFAIGLYVWDYAKNITSFEANKLFDYSRIAVRISSILLTAILTIPVLLRTLHPSQVAESVINRTLVAHVLFSGIFILASMRRKQTADAWIIYIWATGLAFLSQSETAKLVCVVAPFAYMAFRYLGTFGRVISCASIFTYSMAAPWVAGPFFAFIKTLPTSSATFRGAFGARAEIWDGVAQMVQRQPLTGYGFESMRLMKDLPIEGIFWTERLIAHPHNMALQVWADMGIAGALIVAIAFCAAIWSTRKLNPVEAAATASFTLMVFLICQISHGAWQNWWLGVMALSAFFVQTLMIKPLVANNVAVAAHTETMLEKKPVAVEAKAPVVLEEEAEQLCMLEQLDSTIEHNELAPIAEVAPITVVDDIQPKAPSKPKAKKPTKAAAKPAAKKEPVPKKPAATKKPKNPAKPRKPKKSIANDDASDIAAE